MTRVRITTPQARREICFTRGGLTSAARCVPPHTERAIPGTGPKPEALDLMGHVERVVVDHVASLEPCPRHRIHLPLGTEKDEPSHGADVVTAPRRSGASGGCWASHASRAASRSHTGRASPRSQAGLSRSYSSCAAMGRSLRERPRPGAYKASCSGVTLAHAARACI
jgi:hypothetical protein